METQETKQATDFKAMWESYEFDTTQPLLTKDVYAFLGKGGDNEFISQKMSELSGQTINIPPRIKNQDLWNNFVKPFRELPQEKQTTLKALLVSFLQENKEKIEQEQQKESNGKKIEKFADYYGSQYEIRADKPLNKHDILAFYLQYGKGARNKLLELAEGFLGYPINIENSKGEIIEENIVNPILNRGIFASAEFKNIMIENVAQQKAFREQQELQDLHNMIIFNKQEEKIYSVQKQENGVLMKGIDSPMEYNKFEKLFSLNEWKEWKQENKSTLIEGKSQEYNIGDEFIFNFQGKQELFTLTNKRENKENPFYEKIYLSNGTKEECLYKLDIDLHIGQNKIKQVTPEMKEKGILFEKDYESFHLKHLKNMNPSTGLTDKNIYAFLNIKLSEPLAKKREELLEKYFKVPFDDFKKFKKDDMIQKVYGIKKGEDKEAEFVLKSEIQKLFLLSKGEMNSQAPEPYERYLEGLDFPTDKQVWELEHIDKLLNQDDDILTLIEGTPLENDKMLVDLLGQFNDNREFILHSPSFHLGEDQIEAKQNLLNAINHSLDKDQIRNQILENIDKQQNNLTFQQKR